MPRKPKKPVENKPKEEAPQEQPRRHFSVCECGGRRTIYNDINMGHARQYACLDCSRSWEVSAETINTQHGY